MFTYIYYIKLKSRLSVRPSVCTFWHADISAMSARIETRLAENESCVFEDHRVYFKKPMVPTVHRHTLKSKVCTAHPWCTSLDKFTHGVPVWTNWCAVVFGVLCTPLCPNWHTMGVLCTLYFLECRRA